VQAICDFVHNHITFDYQHARPTRTAWEAFNERRRASAAIMRIWQSLSAAAMNIPARYCTGYLGDMGTPPPYGRDGFRGVVRSLSRRRLAYV
jgi:transglutaminase-like putative cysteine protease